MTLSLQKEVQLFAVNGVTGGNEPFSREMSRLPICAFLMTAKKTMQKLNVRRSKTALGMEGL
jgi:hypothetical protein